MTIKFYLGVQLSGRVWAKHTQGPGFKLQHSLQKKRKRKNKKM